MATNDSRESFDDELPPAHSVEGAKELRQRAAETRGSFVRDVPLSTGGTVSGQAEHVATLLAIDHRMQSETQTWTERLRARGVKAAHPDDGWVHRKPDRSGYIHLEYPNFNDGLGEGDLLALGWSWRETRIVRVTKVEPIGRLIPMTYYHFVQVEPDPQAMAQMPAAPVERPSWLLRLFGVRGV